MRILVGLLLGLFVLWGGWWFVASTAEHRAAVAFFAEQRAAGFTAEYSSLGVAGFPNRLDLTVNDVALGDPAAGITWRAPFAQLLALSYNPYHFIAALPHRQDIATRIGTFSVTSDRMEASLRMVPGLAFTLDEIIAVTDRPGLTASTGWQMTAATMRLAARRVPGRPLAQQIGVEADHITPNPMLKTMLDPTGALPETLDQVYLDAEAGFDTAIDRHSATRPPHLTDLSIRDAHVTWGPMLLSATGKITVDAEGVPEGRITIRAKNWKGMVAVAVVLGLVRPELAPTAENMLAELAKGSTDPDVVDLPLEFQKGWMSLGPLPLGPAPRLR